MIVPTIESLPHGASGTACRRGESTHGPRGRRARCRSGSKHASRLAKSDPGFASNDSGVFLQVGSGKSRSTATKARRVCGYNDPLNKQDRLGLRSSEYCQFGVWDTGECADDPYGGYVPGESALPVSSASGSELRDDPPYDPCGGVFVAKWGGMFFMKEVGRDPSTNAVTYLMEFRADPTKQHRTNYTTLDVYGKRPDHRNRTRLVSIDSRTRDAPRAISKPYYAHTTQEVKIGSEVHVAGHIDFIIPWWEPGVSGVSVVGACQAT